MKISTFLFAIFCAISLSFSKENPDENEILSKLPNLTSGGTAGTEFFFSIPPCYTEEAQGLDNFIRVFFVSPIATRVQLAIPRFDIDTTILTEPNGVASIKLSEREALVYQHDGMIKDFKSHIINNGAIRIKSDSPVIVYVVVRYMATSDGFLAYPVSNLGFNYVPTAPSEMGWTLNSGGIFPPWFNITAPYDGTEVKFKLGGSKNVKPIIQFNDNTILNLGEDKTFNLNKGDVLLIAPKNNLTNMSGSVIESNYPISVISGHYCAFIPDGNQWCDYVVEQELPTETWGTTYLVPQIPKRAYSGSIAFANSNNGLNSITNDNDNFFKLSSYGGISGEGYSIERLQQISNKAPLKPRVIQGTKPFSVTYQNHGVQEDYMQDKRVVNSDPFTLVITPLELYQNEILFCTPNLNGGALFDENYLNINIELDDNGEIPDDFELGRYKYNQWIYTKVKNEQGVVQKYMPFTIDNDPTPKHFASKNIQLDFNGLFMLRCQSKKFSSYSYGYGSFDSYGYPTGAIVKDIQTEKRKDTISPGIITLKNENGGYSGEIKDEPSNNNKVRSNLAEIFLRSDLSENFNLNTEKVIAGISSNVKWTLTKIDNSKPSKAVLEVWDKNGNKTQKIFESTAINAPNPPLLTYSDVSCFELKAIMVADNKIDESNILDVASSTFNLNNFTYKEVVTDKTSDIYKEYLLTKVLKNAPANASINLKDKNGNTTFVQFEQKAAFDNNIPIIKTKSITSTNILITAEDFYSNDCSTSNLKDLALENDSKNVELKLNDKIENYVTRSITADLNVIDISKSAICKISATDMAGNKAFLNFSYSPTSVSEIPNDSFVINENNKELNIDFKDNKEYSIHVYDLNSKLIQSSKVEGKYYLLSKSEYLSGTYLLCIQSIDGVKVVKFNNQK